MPETNYIWDPISDSYLMETDENHAATAVYTVEPKYFGNVVSQRRDGDASYYHYDGLGSTRQLTDATGVVTDTDLYDAWGVAVASSGTTENPFQWVGEQEYYFDHDLGMHYVRARPYQPLLSRWTALDPLGLFDSWSGYHYSRNQPLQLTDPSGLIPIECEYTFNDLVYSNSPSDPVWSTVDCSTPNCCASARTSGLSWTGRWREPGGTPSCARIACGDTVLPLKTLTIRSWALWGGLSPRRIAELEQRADTIWKQCCIEVKSTGTTSKNKAQTRVMLGPDSPDWMIGMMPDGTPTITDSDPESNLRVFEPRSRTVNVYFVEDIRPLARVLGFTYPPPATTVVISRDATGVTLAHELGHRMGLDHVFDLPGGFSGPTFNLMRGRENWLLPMSELWHSQCEKARSSPHVV